MCFGIFKKQEPVVENVGDEPIVLPSMSKQDVIADLEEDILIHERWAVLVVQDPTHYPPKNYGDYNWHMKWIEIYKNAIYYLQGGK